jgi:PAS domain S-box-containing protein
MPDGLTEMQPKISHVRRFKPWGWILGTGTYVDDIEQDSRKRLDAVVDELRNTLSQIKIGGSGYMFIFDGDLNLVVHPEYEGTDVAGTVKDAETGELIFRELMKAARTSGHPKFYTWDMPGRHDGHFCYRKRAYVEWFEPLDWYICASVYDDELRAPAVALSRRVIQVAFLFLGVSLGLAVLLSRSLTRPLSRLATVAHRIERSGFDAAEVPVIGTVETRELGHCIGTMLDSIKKSVTEKEELFQAQRRSEENLRITLNSIGDAVIATDMDGRITRMNPVAEKLTGWNFAEARGQRLSGVFQILDRKDRTPLANPVDRVLSSGEISGLQSGSILVSRDGSEYFISDSGAPIRSDDGQVIGVVLVFRDVSDEMALQHRSQVSQKMAAMGQLAGGVAHDFNNMLGGIMGAAELLSEQLPDDESARQLNRLIIETVERASGLTDKLLTFSRTQGTGFTAQDVHRILHDTIALLRSSIDRRITIATDFSAESAGILGDASLLQSAFLNLGINASHAMPDGGTITIRTRTVDLDEIYCAASNFEISPGRYIEVELQDTGCGIPQENLLRIFEPFFTTKEIGKGTGLGLSAVYGTVQQHHGAITVYSEPGIGTRFHLYLPLAAAAVPVEKPSSAAPAFGEGCILVVDDEPLIRTVTKSILESMGYTVLTAADGLEGLSCFREHAETIDLVILDMMMPGMSGRDCFVEMKKIKSTVRVILSSGFAREDEVEAMQAAGLDGFIRKPYRKEDLGRLVHRILSV